MDGNSLETILTQNLAALATAGVFIWYLVRKDKQNQDVFDAFNKTLTNHLHDWIKAQDRFAKSQEKLARNLQSLTDCIKKISNGKTTSN